MALRLCSLPQDDQSYDEMRFVTFMIFFPLTCVLWLLNCFRDATPEYIFFPRGEVRTDPNARFLYVYINYHRTSSWIANGLTLPFTCWHIPNLNSNNLPSFMTTFQVCRYIFSIFNFSFLSVVHSVFFPFYDFQENSIKTLLMHTNTPFGP